MPPLDLKTESSPACAVEWPRWSGEIERAQASHRAARVGSVDALAISSRQFLARLEIAVTLSKQRSTMILIDTFGQVCLTMWPREAIHSTRWSLKWKSKNHW